jgi:HEAT repeat protein
MPRRRPRVEKAIRKNDVKRLLRALHYYDAIADSRGRLIDLAEPVRASAARGLAQIETSDGSAVESALIGALGDHGARVRAEAAHALAVRGARSSVQALASAAVEWNGQYEAARDAALAALADLSGRDEIPRVVQVLTERALSPGHAGEILAGIIASKSEDTRAVAGMAAATVLTEGTMDEIARAVEMLLVLGASSVEPLLTIAWEDQAAKRHAIPILARLGDRRAVPPLCGALDDQDVSVRRAAADALGELADPSAVPALRTAVGDDDYLVRKAALAGLHQLGPIAESASPGAVRSSASRFG